MPYPLSSMQLQVGSTEQMAGLDILNKLLFVDGANSGLDADKHDGKHLSEVTLDDIQSGSVSKKTTTAGANFANALGAGAPAVGQIPVQGASGPAWQTIAGASVVEFANYAAIEASTPKSTAIIYKDLATSKQYRWGGTTLTEISPSLALGESSDSAYRGDRGKTAYDYSQSGSAFNNTFRQAQAAADARALLAAIASTKMPNGATAVYAQDEWPTTDGWAAGNTTLSVATTPGALRATWATGAYYFASKIITNAIGKSLIIRYRTSWAANSIKQLRILGATGGAVAIKTLPNSTEWAIVTAIVPHLATTEYIYIYADSGVGSGDWFEVDYIAIGDVSYSDKYISESGQRLVNQLGNASGAGTAAFATVTSNFATPSDGDYLEIMGKRYTWKTSLTPTEGEVLLGSAYNESNDNMRQAINRYNPSSNDGVKYKCAAANPLVYAINTSGSVLTLVAGTASGEGTTQEFATHPGELGNQIAIAKSASTVTLSGATLSGGVSDVAVKTMNLVRGASLGTVAAGYLPKYDTNALLPANAIKFPATQVLSSDPNALDDYEEGDFTPTLAGSTTAGVNTYSNQQGKYVKIGRTVHCYLYLCMTAKGAMAGNVKLMGLPFAGATVLGNVFHVPLFGDIALGGLSQLGGQISSANAFASLFSSAGGIDQGIYIITASDISDTTSLFIQFSYIV